MTGPCLCGDPYCNSCFPGQAATMKAFDWIEDFFEGEGAVGFTFCQTCRHFRAQAFEDELDASCAVLTLDKHDPSDCPEWAKEHADG